MEPTLNPPEFPNDDPLEALLRAAPAAIADDGFTARVCAALQPRTTAVPRTLRWLVLGGSLLLGCALTFLVTQDLGPWMTAGPITEAVTSWKFEPWYAVAFLIALTVWGSVAVNRNELLSSLSE